ncbi:hypothetical protein [uncultured Tateyamaria sp.]|uniref:hypothetical protein n=1 Tax=uncultured Tateyamaria sp. TaxID=455651 RepID=UPI002618F56A|nr:hypothetical protein [uncultured Tateyamaria sp.]
MTGSPLPPPTDSDGVWDYVDQSFDLTGIFDRATFQQLADCRRRMDTALKIVLGDASDEASEALHTALIAVMAQLERSAFEREPQSFEEVHWRTLCLIDPIDGSFRADWGKSVAEQLWAFSEACRVPNSDTGRVGAVA